jgi:hypothetical protein
MFPNGFITTKGKTVSILTHSPPSPLYRICFIVTGGTAL